MAKEETEPLAADTYTQPAKGSSTASSSKQCRVAAVADRREVEDEDIADADAGDGVAVVDGAERRARHEARPVRSSLACSRAAA